MTSFLTLCSRLATRSGAIGAPPSAVTGQTGRQAKCVDWIVQAWELVQGYHADWGFLHGEWSGSLIDGSASYSADSFNITRFGKWKGDSDNGRYVRKPTTLYDPTIGVSDEGALTEISYEAWRERYDRGTQTPNKPAHYCIAPDQTIRFGPVPNATYSVRGEYVKSPQTLAANADEPDMPAAYHDIIVDRAIMLMAEHDEAPGGLAAAIRSHTEKLYAMRRDLLPQITTVMGR